MPSPRILAVRPRAQPQRTLLERAGLRAPALLRACARPLLALPPGSRPRVALLRRIVTDTYAALDRGDDEAVALYFHPDYVLRFDEHVGPDFEREYRGREEAFAVFRRWADSWGVLVREPRGLVDRGDTLVILGVQVGRGRGSGLRMEMELGQVFRLRGARVVEHTEYRSWERALAASVEA